VCLPLQSFVGTSLKLSPTSVEIRAKLTKKLAKAEADLAKEQSLYDKINNINSTQGDDDSMHEKRSGNQLDRSLTIIQEHKDKIKAIESDINGLDL